ncbi:MAG: apolipoprotein N-acyltransferase [Aquificaceae bacterium]
MRNNFHKPFLWKVALSILTGLLLYLPFSQHELWFLIFFAFLILFKIRDSLFWLLSGFFFFLLSLRCASIAGVEFGGVHWAIFYLLFGPFTLFLSFYQFYLPLRLWQRFLSRALWSLPLLYVLFELFRSYFPLGGFPWLILGSLSVYIPLLRDSLFYANVYFHSLLLLLTSLFLLHRRLKPLLFLWSIFIFLGLFALWDKEKRIKGAESIRVALVQTGVPQEDKLNREAFDRHTEGILRLVETAVSHRVDLVVLPESALPFFFSENRYENYMLEDLSRRSSILVGLIDIREGIRPYNSAYLFANGLLVDYYDKVKLFPIGEYVPKAFGFLKDLFPAIGGIDYVPGEKLKALEHRNIRIATPICFEVAYHDLVKRLSKDANLIAVLTNDGWFKDSDCTHQHYLWARVRALETAKYLLWVNNSGDTGLIDPYGKVIKRLSYMERGIIFHEVKLIP